MVVIANLDRYIAIDLPAPSTPSTSIVIKA
jgi:hypothetical protein